MSVSWASVVKTTNANINNSNNANNNNPTQKEHYKRQKQGEKHQKDSTHNRYIEAEKIIKVRPSICYLPRKTAVQTRHYVTPSTTVSSRSIGPLTALALKSFVNELQNNPRPNLPALFSLPPHYIKKILPMLAPDRVEVRVALLDYQFEQNYKNNPNNNNSDVSSEKLQVISLRDVIESIVDYELRFLAYQKQPNAKALLAQLEPNSIDIWANYNTFRLRPGTPDEDGIFSFYYGAHPPYRPAPGNFDEPSVVSRTTFLERFRCFTHGMFEGWNDWRNMVVVGGSVQACLVHVPEKYREGEALFKWYHKKRYVQSDIDICIYGVDDKKFADKVYALYNFFNKVSDTMVVRTRHTVTLCSKWPRRHVQIVLARWGSIQELIQESDVDCSAVAFDGTKVWTTQRGRLSYNYRSVVATQKSMESRGSPDYENRLMKFSRRGFYIWDVVFSWNVLSDRYLLTAKETTKSDREGRVTGLRLLLCGIKFPKEFSELNIDKDRFFKDTGVPYGPHWTLGKIKQHLREMKYPTDGYGYIVYESSVYSVVSTVRDEQSIISLAKDKLMTPNDLGHRLGKWHDHILLEDDVEEVSHQAVECRYLVGQQCRHKPWVYCSLAASNRAMYYSANFYCQECYTHQRRNILSGDFIYKLSQKCLEDQRNYKDPYHNI